MHTSALSVSLIILFLTFVDLLPSRHRPRHPHDCKWHNSTEYVFSCSAVGNDVFTIYVKPPEYVKIECSWSMVSKIQHQPQDFQFLKGTNVGSVDSISFEGCKLPDNITWPDLTEALGTNATKQLKFKYYSDSNQTFKKDHLKGFEHIEELDLGHNSLKSLADDLLLGFHNLKTLILDGNEFTELPKNLFNNVPQLENLYVRQTDINKFQDGIFSNLTNLKILDLKENNLLESIDENVLADLGNLEELSIYFNHQIESLPDKLFQNLKKLKNLSLCLHNISKVQIPAASQIETFTFSRNKKLFMTPDHNFLALYTKNVDMDLYSNDNITKNLPDNFLKGFNRLKWLDLGGNNIHNLQPNFFNSSSKLEFLTLRKNHLTKLQDEHFANLKSLKILELRKNNLTYLSENVFSDLINLEELDMSNNQLQTLPANLFKNCENLKKIDLNYNELQTLPVDLFKNCKKLRTVEMNYNNFSSIPRVLAQLATELEIFQLQSNQQELQLSDYFLSNFTILGKVKLTDNKINSIAENVFWNSPSIETIFLNKNNLKILPEDLFRDQSNLEVLDLSFNELEHLPDNIFKNLVKVRSLDFKNNHLRKISRNVLQGLTDLKYLDLSANRIFYLHSEFFKSQPKLVHLDLSHNLLSFTDEDNEKSGNTAVTIFRYCKVLNSLTLSNNSIDRVFKDWRQHPSLQYLDISHNKIQKLNIEDISFANDQVMLKLMNNEISLFDFSGVEKLAADLRSTHAPTVNKKEIKGNLNKKEIKGNLNKKEIKGNLNKKEIKVYASHNPINCDCRAYDFLRYLNTELWPSEIGFTPKFDTLDLSCQKPAAFNGSHTAFLDLKDLTCSLEKKDCPQGCDCSFRRHDLGLIVNCTDRGLVSVPERLPVVSYVNHTELLFDGNNIRKLPNVTNPGYSNVTHLNLSKNNISEIQTSFLPSKLQELNLDGNNIKKLSSSMVKYLKNSGTIRKFTVYNNPLVCDSSKKGMATRRRLQSSQISFLSNLTCTPPVQEEPMPSRYVFHIGR